MKRGLIFCIGSAVMTLILGGCAKEAYSTKNDMNKKYFDAWAQVHHPNAAKTELGSYILEEDPGTGKLVGDAEKSPYLYVTYAVTDLNGNYSSYSGADIAQQMGTYNESEYYGAYIWSRENNGLAAGVDEIVSTMKVGGTRKAAIPGWLMTKLRYNKAEDYLKEVSGTDAIYKIKVEAAIEDIVKWEIDSLASYMGRRAPGLDSLSYGFYYLQTEKPSDTTAFKSGSKVYLNYIGRLLNGQAFDTTIQDTAKFYNIFNASRTYEETYVTWADDNDALKLGTSNSDMIEGFEKCIRQMRKGEKGIAFFYSGLGYKSTGSGKSIPGFSPLIFEMECLGNEEEDSNE